MSAGGFSAKGQDIHRRRDDFGLKWFLRCSVGGVEVK